MITELAWEYYSKALTDVLPALGTHSAMTDEQIRRMFGNIPKELFPGYTTSGLTLLPWVRYLLNSFTRSPEGKLDYAWPAQVNKLLVEGGHDLILSQWDRSYRMRS